MTMKTPTAILLLLLLLLTGAASAQSGQASLASLQDALTLVTENSAGVTNARNTLQASERARSRTQADPLALSLETLHAEYKVGNSESALRNAILAARAEALAAYADVLNAENELRAAELNLEMARMTASAAEIRFSAGAVTQLDVDRAGFEQAAAERRLADSSSTLQLARSNLGSLAGVSPAAQLAPLTEPEQVQPLDEVLRQLESNSQLQQARQAVTTAELELAATDNPLSSQAQIEQARSALQGAEADLASLERSLDIAVRQSYNTVVSARGNFETALARVTTARETLEAQQLRFGAGSISQLELHQAELDLLNADSQSSSALHSLLAAIQALQRSVAGSGGAR
jgi:outer membrane protein TolC